MKKRVHEEKWYVKLRGEHTRRIQSGYYAERLGCTCVNCGEKCDTYHHIVPLAGGGTNKLSNIVPVCDICHKTIHGNRDRSEYEVTSRGGRPRVCSQDEWDAVLSEYALCHIGYKEAMKKLKRKMGSHLADSKYYKDFCEEHGIKKIRNLVETYKTTGRLERGKYAGYIELESGQIIEMVY